MRWENYTPPSTPNSTGTQGSGIDNKGRTAGLFLDVDNAQHGFLRLRDGALKRFHPTGSINTTVEAVDSGTDKRAIVGEFADQNFTFHGFIRTP